MNPRGCIHAGSASAAAAATCITLLPLASIEPVEAEKRHAPAVQHHAAQRLAVHGGSDLRARTAQPGGHAVPATLAGAQRFVEATQTLLNMCFDVGTPIPMGPRRRLS